jgi:hypothetical protein
VESQPTSRNVSAAAMTASRALEFDLSAERRGVHVPMLFETFILLQQAKKPIPEDGSVHWC